MTKIDKAQTELGAALNKLGDLRAQHARLRLEAARLEADGTNPESVSLATATRQALANLDADIERHERETLPALRAKVERLEEERRALAASIAASEKRCAPYAPNLAHMEQAAGLLLTLLRVQSRAGEEKLQQNALTLLLWVREMRQELANLPAWRERLRDYGE